ncbi:MAG: HAMP domain-containing histidine kinase [Candidatus Nanopelagicales bacterium]|jgi:signal transduction histidine kinase|nr:HAMP domain-containing histidine kinase [Candidatus Nanopelagicales bacterium]
MRFGLRSRVALVFAVLSMLVALVVSTGIYLASRAYLTNQRETTSLSRALTDARSVDAAIAGGMQPGRALAQLPVVGSSQALMRVGTQWFSRGASVLPADLPTSLIDMALSSGGGQQRIAVGDETFYAVSVYTRSGLYVELFPLEELEAILDDARVILAILAIVAFLVGGAVGSLIGRRLMRPLELLGAGAQQLASGDLSVRLPDTGDPDLDPISDSFNEMAVAVASRIDRERRFVANVSHELRSPLTTVVATAELLESHRDAFGPREARLVTSLAGQSRRLSRILLDLLEISSVTASAPVQRDATDVAALAEQVLVARNLPPRLVSGDRPVVVTDARRIERVLANLVDNATRHGQGVRQVLVVQGDHGVRIHVDDAGPGVEPDGADRLFEPFARGERAEEHRVEGAGLGLAIVRDQADAIGASIAVRRSPFGGARFTLDLPADPVEPPDQALAPAAPVPDPGKQERPPVGGPVAGSAAQPPVDASTSRRTGSGS